MKKLVLLIITTFLCSTTILAEEIASGLILKDEYTIVGKKNFMNDFIPLNNDGTINIIVEIPTGTIGKWEVDKSDGNLKWEFKKGKPRIVKFLGYPGNYGMIPRTMLPKELGGDGDPLDVIVLGPSVPRGSVVSAKLIGVLKLLDGGEQDDKLLAVLENSPLFGVNNVSELNRDFNGVTKIVEIWFESYKGPGEIISNGFGNNEEALKILNFSINEYKKLN